MIELSTFHQNSLIKMSHRRVVILMSSIYIRSIDDLVDLFTKSLPSATF